MNDLISFFISIREKIKKHRYLYERNEQAVRDHIINPILKKLGWDPANPEDVLPNTSTDEGIPDYSLIKNSKRILFVEAKKLNVDIEQKEIISQLAKYSFSEGTKYGILSNGAVWVLFRSFVEGTTLSERIVWKIDLENEELQAICRKIMTISKTNIEQIEVLVKKAQILDEIIQDLFTNPDDMIKGLMPVVKSLIDQKYPDYKFEDIEIIDLLKERLKSIITGKLREESSEFEEEVITIERPRKMKLKGEEFALRNSYEILINTANWLINNGKLTSSNCPVSVGRGNRYLINKEPIHRNNKTFTQCHKLSNGLFIETHASTSNIIEQSHRLLEHFSLSRKILIIE